MSNYQALAGYPAASLAGAGGLAQAPMPIQLMNGAAVSAAGHIPQVLQGAPQQQQQPQIGTLFLLSIYAKRKKNYFYTFFEFFSRLGLFIFSLSSCCPHIGGTAFNDIGGYDIRSKFFSQRRQRFRQQQHSNEPIGR